MSDPMTLLDFRDVGIPENRLLLLALTIRAFGFLTDDRVADLMLKLRQLVADQQLEQDCVKAELN